jgi:hypothetical protein
VVNAVEEESLDVESLKEDVVGTVAENDVGGN